MQGGVRARSAAIMLYLKTAVATKQRITLPGDLCRDALARIPQFALKFRAQHTRRGGAYELPVTALQPAATTRSSKPCEGCFHIACAAWNLSWSSVYHLCHVCILSGHSLLERVYLLGYTMDMLEIRQTEIYAEWFASLRDRQARARIDVRIRRLSLGNPGDVRPVGEGVSELRIDYGPGYRVYFVQRGQQVVILLAGGDKRTQAKDIEKAIALAHDV